MFAWQTRECLTYKPESVDKCRIVLFPTNSSYLYIYIIHIYIYDIYIYTHHFNCSHKVVGGSLFLRHLFLSQICLLRACFKVLKAGCFASSISLRWQKSDSRIIHGKKYVVFFVPPLQKKTRIVNVPIVSSKDPYFPESQSRFGQTRLWEKSSTDPAIHH